MTLVLTMASTVLCGPGPGVHLGPVQKQSTAKLTVQASAVLTEAGIKQSVSGCTTPTTSSTTPCTTVSTISPSSLATKLTTGGKGVVLETLSGVTDGTPPGSLKAVAIQAKLTAV